VIARNEVKQPACRQAGLTPPNTSVIPNPMSLHVPCHCEAVLSRGNPPAGRQVSPHPTLLSFPRRREST
jgi:hypothetical protein